MSSLAAARADGFYFGPDFDPSQPRPGKPQNRSSVGLLIIRFEVPFKVWCTGCGGCIDKGVRFNAEKKRVGSYLSTPVYSFRMHCKLCRNELIITTDPKNARYICTKGLRQKQEGEESLAEDDLLLPLQQQRLRMDADPLYRREQVFLMKQQEERRKRMLEIREAEKARLRGSNDPEGEEIRQPRAKNEEPLGADVLDEQSAKPASLPSEPRARRGEAPDSGGESSPERSHGTGNPAEALRLLWQRREDDFAMNRLLRERLKAKRRRLAEAGSFPGGERDAGSDPLAEAEDAAAAARVRFRRRRTAVEALAVRLRNSQESIFDRQNKDRRKKAAAAAAAAAAEAAAGAAGGLRCMRAKELVRKVEKAAKVARKPKLRLTESAAPVL